MPTGKTTVPSRRLPDSPTVADEPLPSPPKRNPIAHPWWEDVGELITADQAIGDEIPQLLVEYAVSLGADDPRSAEKIADLERRLQADADQYLDAYKWGNSSERAGGRPRR
jgi:hypothetical protein